jgi:hypothetical protein
MTLFDDLMKQEAYRKLFELFPESQRHLIIDGVKKFMEDAEKNIINESTKKDESK